MFPPQSKLQPLQRGLTILPILILFPLIIMIHLKKIKMVEGQRAGVIRGIPRVYVCSFNTLLSKVINLGSFVYPFPINIFDDLAVKVQVIKSNKSRTGIKKTHKF